MSTRVQLARGLAVVGALASNWWIAVPFLSRIVDPRLGLFSDLEVPGMTHANTFRGLDLLAGSLFLVALLMRGHSSATSLRRPEFPFLVAYSAATMMGALSPYVCAESTYASCRQLEWHLQLAPRHYFHIAAGIAEFALITVAAVLLDRRVRHLTPALARSARGALIAMALAYPALAVVYLFNRFGAFVEPIFFMAFGVVVFVEVFEALPVELIPLLGPNSENLEH